jgi:hypothetical protein
LFKVAGVSVIIFQHYSLGGGSGYDVLTDFIEVAAEKAEDTPIVYFMSVVVSVQKTRGEYVNLK